MARWLTGALATMQAYDPLAVKAYDCPVPATRRGGGEHVPMVEAMCDGYDEPVEHPSTPGLYRYRAIDIDNDPEAHPELLTAPELAQMQADWTAAAPLDPSWYA